MERGCGGGLGFDAVGLVHRDVVAERLGLTLDGLGIDVQPGQFVHQRAALGEADPPGGETDHAPHRR